MLLNSRMFSKSSFYFLGVFCLVFPFKGFTQSFEWESEPMIFPCNVSFTKIVEISNQNLFLIGDKNCSQQFYQFNNFGQLQAEFNHGYSVGGFEDLISYDESKTHFLIGIANSFPTTVNFYNIDRYGKFHLKIRTITGTYLTNIFCDKVIKNKILTAGYAFPRYRKYYPAIEYRSLNGDTLGKYEYPLPWNAMARKVYLNKEDNSIMLFCSENGWGKITVLRIDTLGKLLETKAYSKNLEYYSNYLEMTKKDSSYYMLVDIDDTPRRLLVGYFLIRFNSKGDSVSLTPINKRYNSIAATKDNGLVLAGTSLLKLDSNLNVVWEKPFKEGVEIQSVGESMLGGYFGSGRIYNKTLNEYRTYVFRTNSNGDIETKNNYPQYQIYPNPFKDELRFELPFGEAFNITLYDMQGKTVVEINCVGSTYVNLPNLQQGVYLVNVNNKEGKQLYYNKFLKID